MCIDHFCYLSINLLINIYFVIHNEILSWFLDQFCKRQIALFVTDHLKLLLAIKIYICAKYDDISVHFKKTFVLKHLRKVLDLYWKRCTNYWLLHKEFLKLRTILSPFCHNLYVLVKGRIFNAKYLCYISWFEKSG